MALDSAVMNISIATVAKDAGTTVSGMGAITAYTLATAVLTDPRRQGRRAHRPQARRATAARDAPGIARCASTRCARLVSAVRCAIAAAQPVQRNPLAEHSAPESIEEATLFPRIRNNPVASPAPTRSFKELAQPAARQYLTRLHTREAQHHQSDLRRRNPRAHKRRGAPAVGVRTGDHFGDARDMLAPTVWERLRGPRISASHTGEGVCAGQLRYGMKSDGRSSRPGADPSLSAPAGSHGPRPSRYLCDTPRMPCPIRVSMSKGVGSP